MDAWRFDAWTRRRFGLAVGGVVSSFLGLSELHQGESKNKKKRCRKAGRTCKRGKDCCGSLTCEETGDPSRLRCCRGENGPCLDDNGCCGVIFCGLDNVCHLPSSDRNLKANFGSVDPADMLARVRELPISTWNYTSDDPAIRHIGPMAQDFATTFGVGADDRHIHPLDGPGVALAAIQGLIAELAYLRDENQRLAERIAALEQGRD